MNYLMRRRTRLFSFLILVQLIIIGISPILVQAKERSSKSSFLKIESGMHVASIWRIGADSSCRLIATASDDKTVRLWKAVGTKTTFKASHIFRTQIGIGHDGKFTSVAVSPDGTLVAAGAMLGKSKSDQKKWGFIYIFDTQTGKMEKSWPIDARPNDLAFSLDGKKLAVALHQGFGHRVYDTDGWTFLGKDEYSRNKKEPSIGAENQQRDPKNEKQRLGQVTKKVIPEGISYGLAFDKENRLYTVAYDGFLRRYLPSSKYSVADVKAPLHERKKPYKKRKPYAVAVHPNGSQIAVAYNDTGPLEIFNETNLLGPPVYSMAVNVPSPETKKKQNKDNEIFTVAWTNDGKRLFGGGKPKKEIEGGPKQYPLFFWEHNSFGDAGQAYPQSNLPIKISPTRLDGPTNSVIDLIPCGNGKIALAAQDPAFWILNRNGVPLFKKNSPKVDMRGKSRVNENKKESNFMVSKDGMRIRFNLSWGGVNDFQLFDLQKRSLKPSPIPPQDMYAATISLKGLEIENWNGSRTPSLQGEQIPSWPQNETAHSLAISYDENKLERAILAIGAEWSIHKYQLQRNCRNLSIGNCQKIPFVLTKKSERVFDATSMAWGVNIAKNGKLLVVASGDGTIRWHSLNDDNLKELLALYVHPDEPQKWVAWTPKGYYMASGEGEWIGYHVNNGRDRKATFYPIGSFRKTCDHASIVKSVIPLLDEDKAISEAVKIGSLSPNNMCSLKHLPPIMNVVEFDNSESPKIGKENCYESSFEPDLSFTKSEIQVKYCVDSPSGDPVRGIKVRIDDKSPILYSHSPKQQFRDISLPIKQKVKVSLTAFTKFSESKPIHVRYSWKGDPDRLKSIGKPKRVLRAVVVGISAYPEGGSIAPLNFAADDAAIFSKFLRDQQGDLFEEVDVAELIDKDRLEIQDAFRKMINKAHEDSGKNIDTTSLFFFSGHGESTQYTERLFLLPTEANLKDLEGTALRAVSLFEDLALVPGKKIMILDACRTKSLLTSGYVNADSFQSTVKGGQTSSFMLLLSSIGNENLSYECPKCRKGDQVNRKNRTFICPGCKNGFFTLALLKAFKKKALDVNPSNNLMGTNEILSHIPFGVEEIASKTLQNQRAGGLMRPDNAFFDFAKMLEEDCTESYCFPE